MHAAGLLRARRAAAQVLLASLCACTRAEVAPGRIGADAARGGPSTMRAPDAFALPPADTSPETVSCATAPGEDRDQDGYAGAAGDCNDCDSQVNPGAFDVSGNQVDEDCSGRPDDEPAGCDADLAVDGDAFAAARALGLCRVTSAAATGTQRSWGVLNAAYVFPDGSTAALGSPDVQCGRPGEPPNPLSHGILAQFGRALKPRQGAAMLALSSGIARAGKLDHAIHGESPAGAQMCTHSRTPPGFPVSSQATCGDIENFSSRTDANDAIALELTIRVPTNAAALSFDFDFYTWEYHEFVCSEFNDGFVALLESKAPDLPANRNVAFDSQRNPVSVNNGFVEVCQPFTYVGRRAGQRFTRPFPCALGVGELAGTGFENHAATGWLETKTNVVPGEEIRLRFAIWDAGDESLDSTVLLDNLKWATKGGSTVTVRPPPVE